MFIAGDVVDSIVRQALGLRVWDTEIPLVTVADDVNKAIREFNFDDMTAEDFLNGITALAEAGTALGVPIRQTTNMVGGKGDLIDGSYQVGLARLLGWSEFRAEKEFEKTLGINPNMPDAISHYGYLMALTGNEKKAIALGEKSMEIDPFSPMTNLNYMGIHWISMDQATSLKLSKNIIDLYPNFWGGHFCIGLYYWSQQEYKKAIQSFKDGLKLQPSIWLISFVGSLYGIIGEKDKAHSMLAKMDEMTKKQQIASFSYALVYAGLNDLKKAFDFLEKASEERTGLLIFLDIIRRQNWIPAFKNNARLLEYIERVGIPQARI